MEDKSLVESQRPVQLPADLHYGDHLLDAYESFLLFLIMLVLFRHQDG